MLRWRLILGLLLVGVLIGACLADISSPGAWLGIVSICVVALGFGRSGRAVARGRAGARGAHWCTRATC